jgi:hypothetical protein
MVNECATSCSFLCVQGQAVVAGLPGIPSQRMQRETLRLLSQFTITYTQLKVIC